jgi:hypothetical protein
VKDNHKWLGVACMAAALLSAFVLGASEHAHPFFGRARYQVLALPLQRWAYAAVQTLKAFGFLAGLFGFFLAATRRGVILKIIMALATVGAIFFGFVWIMIAVTARDDAIYIWRHPIGSDLHSNGGAFFLWLAPIALGIAALFANRISRWWSVWPIITGLVGFRIFGLFTPGVALIVEGFIWLVLGLIVYLHSGSAEQIVGPEPPPASLASN